MAQYYAESNLRSNNKVEIRKKNLVNISDKHEKTL